MNIRFYLKGIAFIVVMVILLGSVRYLFKESSAHLQKVDIIAKGDLDYISKPQIIDLIKPFQKANWWELSVDELGQALKSYPGIKEIKVQKKWPNQLVVELTEYQAQAYWGSQKEVLLSDGEIIAPKYFSAKFPLPTFLGDQQDAKVIKQNYKTLQQIAQKYGFSIANIAYQGNQWQVVLSINVEISLGSENIENKLNQLLENYKNIKVPKKQKLATVDMRYQSGFAVGFVHSS